jgi:hypothetical protein
MQHGEGGAGGEKNEREQDNGDGQLVVIPIETQEHRLHCPQS